MCAAGLPISRVFRVTGEDAATRLHRLCLRSPRRPEDPAATTTGKDNPVLGVARPALHVPSALRSGLGAGGPTSETGARRANPDT